MTRRIDIKKMRILFLMICIILILGSVLGFSQKVTQRFDMRIQMRDSVELSADMWMPAEVGRYPTILLRTPYIKTTPRHKFPEFGHYFAARGYVFMVEEVRGRGDSDGRAVRLGPKLGVIRARYRNGYEKTDLLTPGKPEKFTIDLFHIGHAFLKGHRIRVEISSSAFPFINPNQNTGNPVATDTEWKIANQTVYHNSQRPSHILLPVMPFQSDIK